MGFGDRIPGNWPLILSIFESISIPSTISAAAAAAFRPSGDLVRSIEAKRAAGDTAPPSKAKAEAAAEEEEAEGDVAFGPVKRWTSDMNSLGFAWMILGETV